MVNPFDWKNNPRVIDMSDVELARKASHQQSVAINRRRAQGIEPSIVYSPKTVDLQPKNFVTAMPVMAKHDKNAAARRLRAAKKEGKA